MRVLRRRKAAGIIASILAVLMMSVFFMACGDKTPSGGGDDDYIFELNHSTATLAATTSFYLVLDMDERISVMPTWTSSDPSVVTVTQNSYDPMRGDLLGISEGTAKITVSAAYNGKTYTDECAVTVTEAPEAIVLTIANEDKNFELLVGRTRTVTYSATPAGTVVDVVSKDPLVAGVAKSSTAQEFTVTGYTQGTTSIEVTAGIGEGSQTQVVTVNVKQPAVSLDKSGLQLLENQIIELTATSNGEVEFDIEQDGEILELGEPVADTDPITRVVTTVVPITALISGSAKVVASYGGVEAECEIVIKESVYTVTVDEAVSLDYGDGTTLTATVKKYTAADLDPETNELDYDNPAKGTVEVNPELVWVAGEEGLVTVTNGAVLAGDEHGETTVTVSFEDPEGNIISAVCAVTVNDPYGDWTRISNYGDLMNWLNAPENEDVKRPSAYLAADIDAGGAMFNVFDSAGNFSSTLDGRGFHIYNLEFIRMFHVIESTAKIQNLHLTATDIGGSNQTLALAFNGGTIENCRFDIEFANPTTPQPHKSMLSVSTTGGTIKDSLFIASGSVDSNNNCAALFVQGGNATIVNSFFRAGATGPMGNNGLTPVSAVQLIAAGTYSAWDTNIWNIVDGQIPSFIDKNATIAIDGKDTVNKDFEIGDKRTYSATTNVGGVIWVSDNTDIATVNAETGEVTAVSGGTAVITAMNSRNGTKTDSITVTVKAAVTLSFTETAVYLKAGGSLNLSELLETNREDIIGNFVWSAEGNAGGIITLDSSTATAVKGGDVTVKVTSTVNENVVSESITVSVVTLNLSSSTAFLAPAAGNADITAEISHGAVEIEVDPNACVTANLNDNVISIAAKPDSSDGDTAVITVKSLLVPELTATITVTIDASVGPTITMTEAIDDIIWKDTRTLSPTIANIADKTVNWVSDKPDVVSVTSGGVIEVLQNVTDTVTIRATLTAAAGNVYAECVISLTAVDMGAEITDDVTDDQDGLILRLTGETFTAFTFTVADDRHEVYFESSDTSVLSLSAGGDSIELKKSGVVTVSIKSGLDDSVLDTLKVYVLGVSITNKAAFTATASSFSLGKTFTFTASEPSVGGVTWSTSNAAIISVENGVITANALGTATITLSSDIDGFETVIDTIEVRVIDAYDGYTKIGTRQEFLTYMNAGALPNEKILLTADIDMQGHTVNSEVWKPGDFSGIIDGQGYEVYNFTVNRALFNWFAGGTLKNIMFTYTSKINVGNGSGPIANGYGTGLTMENCLFDINLTNASSAWQAIFHHEMKNLKVTNSIILLNFANPVDFLRIVGQAASANVTGSYYHIKAGSATPTNVGTNGFTLVSEASLKNPNASQWSAYDKSIWGFSTTDFPYLLAPRALNSVTIDQGATADVIATETLELTAKVAPARIPADQKEIVWSLADGDEAYAAIDPETGVLTGLKAGEGKTVTVTAASAVNPEVKDTIDVTILAETDITIANKDIIEARYLEIDATNAALNSVTLSASANRGSFTWSIVSGGDVVSIAGGKGENCVVTALSAGEAVIRATSDANPSKYDEITITVNAPVTLDIKEGDVTVTEKAIAVDGTVDLGALLTTNREDVIGDVRWSIVGGDGIVTVNAETGVVTGVSRGTVTVRVTSDVNGATADVEVTVVTINAISDPAALLPGASVDITAITNDPSAEFTTDAAGADVIEISQIGLTATITAKPASEISTATVTVTSKLVPSVSVTFTVTVDPTAAATLTLDKNTLSLVLDDTATLTATLVSDNADKTVNWASDNPAVTVSGGVVTVVSNVSEVTTVTVTASSNADPNVKDTCVITLTPVEITVDIMDTLNRADGLVLTLADDGKELTAKVPYGGFEFTVEDGKESVLTITADGTLTLVGGGEAVVTLTSLYDGGITATIKIYVLDVSITNKEAAQAGLPEGDTSFTFTASTPVLGTVVWSSSNEDAATIDASTGAVETFVFGTTTITASVTDSESEVTVTDTFELNVNSSLDTAATVVSYSNVSYGTNTTVQIDVSLFDTSGEPFDATTVTFDNQTMAKLSTGVYRLTNFIVTDNTINGIVILVDGTISITVTGTPEVPGNPADLTPTTVSAMVIAGNGTVTKGTGNFWNLNMSISGGAVVVRLYPSVGNGGPMGTKGLSSVQGWHNPTSVMPGVGNTTDYATVVGWSGGGLYVDLTVSPKKATTGNRLEYHGFCGLSSPIGNIMTGLDIQISA